MTQGFSHSGTNGRGPGHEFDHSGTNGRSPDALVDGLRRSGLIAVGDRVFVAVSCGPDTTAMLPALWAEAHQVAPAHYAHPLLPPSPHSPYPPRPLFPRSRAHVLVA